MSERSYDLLTKIIRAVPKRSEGKLQDILGEDFMSLSEGNVSEFQRKKASGALPTNFPTIDEKDDIYRIKTEVEPLLGASGYRNRRNILMTHGKYPCHCLAQTLWYPQRESGVSMGRGGVVLHGVARPKPASVDCDG